MKFHRALRWGRAIIEVPVAFGLDSLIRQHGSLARPRKEAVTLIRWCARAAV